MKNSELSNKPRSTRATPTATKTRRPLKAKEVVEEREKEEAEAKMGEDECIQNDLVLGPAQVRIQTNRSAATSFCTGK